MEFIRPRKLIATAMAGTLGLVACGGNKLDPPPIESGNQDTHRTYVYYATTGSRLVHVSVVTDQEESTTVRQESCFGTTYVVQSSVNGYGNFEMGPPQSEVRTDKSPVCADRRLTPEDFPGEVPSEDFIIEGDGVQGWPTTTSSQ